MSRVVVFKIKNKNINNEDQNRDILWYDYDCKKMKKFNGIRLEFEYKLDKTLDNPKFRMVPKVIKAEKNVNVEKKKDIEDWYDKYLNYNNSSSEIIENNSHSIEFRVPDSELDDFLYDLERNGFRSEVL